MGVDRHLTLLGRLERNAPSQTSSGAFADTYQTVREDVACRISQPGKNRAIVGGQQVADLAPVILFGPEEDVRDQDRIVITSGTPQQLIGTTWDLYSPVIPSVPLYLSATGRRIETAAG